METRASSPIPTVSVVIPTIGRLSLLKRAINSCLVGRHSNLTEVIVIANGPAANDSGIQELCTSDERIRLKCMAAPDQNVARNAGMEIARGELIRFLDDDDYLIPDAAARQCDLMLHKPLDFCSAAISVKDKNGNEVGHLTQPNCDCNLIAILGPNRCQMVHSHLYRRTSIGALRWPTAMKQSEDITWLVRYVVDQPRQWQRMDEIVGVWYQHDGPRQSLDRPSGSVHEPTAKILLEARESLLAQGRWTPETASAVADSLWQLVHRAFPFNPIFWSKIALQAGKMDKKSRPDYPMYRYRVLRKTSPLLLQWVMLPKRWISLLIESLRALRHGRDYRRTL